VEQSQPPGGRRWGNRKNQSGNQKLPGVGKEACVRGGDGHQIERRVSGAETGHVIKTARTDLNEDTGGTEACCQKAKGGERVESGGRKFFLRKNEKRHWNAWKEVNCKVQAWIKGKKRGRNDVCSNAGGGSKKGGM